MSLRNMDVSTRVNPSEMKTDASRGLLLGKEGEGDLVFTKKPCNTIF